MDAAVRRRAATRIAPLGAVLLSLAACGGDPTGAAPQAGTAQALAAPVPLAGEAGAPTVNTRSASAMAGLVGLAAATSVVPVEAAASLPTQAGTSPEAGHGPSQASEVTARQRKAERYCMSTRQQVWHQAAARHRGNSRLESRLGGCTDETPAE